MCVSVCMSVPLQKHRFLVDWRLLVKEHIANIGITLASFFFKDLWGFFVRFLGQYKAYYCAEGGVSRTRVRGCACFC